MNRRQVLLPLLALLAALASACGGGIDPNAPDASDKLSIAVPSSVGALVTAIEPEATKKLKGEKGKGTYVRDGTVFSLRLGKELKALFQVIRLTADARPDDPEFRRKIVLGIGGARRKPERVGDVLLYTARTNQQIYYVWFNGRFMEVLIVREEKSEQGGVTAETRALLNILIAIKPTPIA